MSGREEGDVCGIGSGAEGVRERLSDDMHLYRYRIGEDEIAGEIGRVSGDRAV